ncbi:MAG: threonine synthase [Alphaproteobacteria bacterium]|nr:threonine synthase [Alphaproteobacteria bacterium]
MRYVSTRGAAPVLSFDDVVLTGLARDGGLYVPETMPRWSEAEWASLAGLSYAEIAVRVLKPFVGDTISQADLAAMVHDTYRNFRHPAVAPLKQLGSNDWLLELFHGPTIAFKDYALQLLGRLFDHVLTRRGQRMAVLGATSGDTGSAAIEACKDRRAVDIFILFPHGRVSDVQRRQMTTVASANVHAIAVEGTFDDCQDLVKACFGDLAFRDEVGLGAVNSINWARIVAQTVYYVVAAVAVGAPSRSVSFAVPTGNFGNVYAATVARAMGLPIDRLVIGSNRNDILTRLFTTGVMEIGAVEPSLSPSMDIQVSSNLERYLFELMGRDGTRIAEAMHGFRTTGRFALPADSLATAQRLFSAHRVDDQGTLATMARVHDQTGELLDPHTAVGIAASLAHRGDPRVPMISLACAHPAKFVDAAVQAIGTPAPLPRHLSGLMAAEERMTVLPNSVAAVQSLMRGALAR